MPARTIATTGCRRTCAARRHPDAECVCGQLIAWDRDEAEACQRGTPGCAIDHIIDLPCESW